MFFWIVQCTRHFLVTRPILDTLRPRAWAAAAAEAAPGVPAVPKPAVPQLRIVILSGATQAGSQDRFKLPATRAVTMDGHLKRWQLELAVRLGLGAGGGGGLTAEIFS